MGARSDLVLNSFIAAAVVAVAGVYLWDRLGPPRDSAMRTVGQNGDAITQRVSDESWASMLAAARLSGPENAPVKFIIFSDFECPFCKRLHPRIRRLQAMFGDTLSVHLVHFPLSQHRFAEGAASAAECAVPEGRFTQMEDALFARPDSFGLKPWVAYAVDAGIADTATFTACMTSGESRTILDRGRQIGREIGIRGTPALVVNRTQYFEVPSDNELEALIRALATGPALQD